MSVTIRLARTGRKNLPTYKIVVSNTRDKRNGRFVDILGYFNPSAKPQLFDYDKAKFDEWVKKGAMVSQALTNLIKGKYEYIKYTPVHMEKKAEGGAKEETKNEKTEEPKKETSKEAQ